MYVFWPVELTKYLEESSFCKKVDEDDEPLDEKIVVQSCREDNSDSDE